ncbi:bifunctional lysylphosphatidylglycerol synthetase/lysine--tRNA ligase LysX [uncultured Corynebacterium sp.]|uniref:bifunctional lysylphosphatidylglycerol synthetase/lysine--tRNA ligase LysX n=1 Tax=uncultured Corynebacterium sp. TaxID=159447 RepID=UPI0025F08970|nr:bifunctional lysylphosphatidylglycerol synthetase/lysine--tRNA ligase LysX [uncultured Corynebacterium sp.]
MNKTVIRRFIDATPTWYGWLLTLHALVALVFSLVPAWRGPLWVVRIVFDIVLLPLPETSAAWAVALFLLAGGIFARKRVAWWVAVAMTLVVLAMNVAGLWLWFGDVGYGGELGIAGLLVLGSVVQAVILVLVVAARGAFRARVRPGAVWRAVGTYVVTAATAVLAGWALIAAFPAGFRGPALPVDEQVLWALNKIVGLSLVDPRVFSGRPPTWVDVVLGIFGALAIIAATYVLLRSQSGRNALTSDDETALRALLTRWGDDDSLGYFATRRDKSVVYADSGLAAVTFRVEVGVALASGDPVGDPEEWDSAIAAFLARAEEFGWTPAAMGASVEGARAYRRHGLMEFHLGDEAVLDTSTFRLSGPDRKSVRQAVQRARNAGATVRIRRHGDLSAEELAAVSDDADAWRDTTDERGFSMALGRLGDPADAECLLVETLVDDRRVALLSFSPWGRTGASLDLMRRAPQAPNGSVELMVTELCRAGDDVGVARISLNFAVFREVFASEEELGVGPVRRTWRLLLVFLSRFWQMETLYRSNDRYGPEWVPRYLCYPAPRSVARVAMASGIAEGFIPWPTWQTLRDFSGAVDRSPGAVAAYAAVPGVLADVNRLPKRRVPEQTGVRIAAARRMKDDGIDPWTIGDHPTDSCAGVVDAPVGTRMSVAGRVMARRDFGGVVFLEVRDFDGTCQVLVERDHATGFDRVGDIDLADLVRVEGVRGTSRRGEPSLIAEDWAIEAKSLHPLPDKVRGLRDPEARARNRHVDLAVGEDSRRVLKARSAVLGSLRASLSGDDFLEVETPILQRVHGGANARPFATHINAYDMGLYLRIAPELYLKRLMCGGVDRVFELGRVFRNEGVDATHNPEFTILEAYAAHDDYVDMRLRCQKMIQDAAIAANGECVVRDPEGNLVDISGDWPVKTLFGAVTEAIRAAGIECLDLDGRTPEADLRALCEELDIPARADWDAGQIALEMYEHLVEEQTTFPTFYTDFPLSVSPLTRTHRTDPTVTERWDLVAWGVELGTAYTELTDPLDQRHRLEAQSFAAAGGDPEAMQVDEDFLKALEFGMPPAGGLGMGVDRVVMLITGATIRESLAFPFVRDENR